MQDPTASGSYWQRCLTIPLTGVRSANVIMCAYAYFLLFLTAMH